MSEDNATRTITAARFEFLMQAEDAFRMPDYKGSTLRGAFGHMFKRTVCALRSRECAQCMMKETCVYAYVFETPPPADTGVMRKYTAAPHPFVIEPPLERTRLYKPGDRFSFGLVLLGRAVQYLPYFIYTFEELGRTGMGRDKGRFSLLRVSHLGGDAPHQVYQAGDSMLKKIKPENVQFPVGASENTYDGDSVLAIDFHTPTRIQFNGSLTIDLDFHVLVRQLMRRLALLAYFHCGIDTSTWDFTGMINAAGRVQTVDSKLFWHDWQRYSNRQKTSMKMGGFLGRITYQGPVEPFLPLVRAGELCHVGKGTSFGLGKYAVTQG